MQENQLKDAMHDLGRRARQASKEIAYCSSESKQSALHAIALRLEENVAELMKANSKDIEAAEKASLDIAMIDRLTLNEERIAAMAQGCRQVAALEDPVGKLSEFETQASGIRVGKMRVPLGVIGIIYESRPNVTVDAAILCLQAGNACILRGGSEAIHSNRAIVACVSQGLCDAGLPRDAVQVIDTTDRAAVGVLITMSDFVDVLIPRGGKSLIERISKDASVPVIKHLDGVCHVYLDVDADADKAKAIALNAKTHRYGVCNAMETLLVHAQMAVTVLPDLAKQYQDLGVELRCCEHSQALLSQHGITTTPAQESDWHCEYLAPILSIKMVASAQDAIEHIDRYSSDHTEAIVTENKQTADWFLRVVDSASVMVNASTRFADGFEYGLGAEIGISTDKLHARGPVGIEGLTTQKYIVIGDGHIRR